MRQWPKRGLVVAKKLVVNDFGYGSCKSQSKPIRKHNVLCQFCSLLQYDLTKSTSRSNTEIVIFKNFP